MNTGQRIGLIAAVIAVAVGITAYNNNEKKKLEQINTQPVATVDNSFATDFKSSFIGTCASGSISYNTCSCMADYLIDNFSEPRLTSMAIQYKTSGNIPDELYLAINNCKGVY